MSEQDRTGAYNPFEDTGDWPFRESAPPPVQRTDEPSAPFDLERHDPPPEEPEPIFAPYVPPEEPEPAEPEPAAESEPEPEPEPEPVAEAEPAPDPEHEQEPEQEQEHEQEPVAEAAPEPEPEEAPPESEEIPAAAAVAAVAEEHAPGDLEIPAGPEVLEGSPNGFRRTVAIVVGRFNADITNRLLEGAVDALQDAHVNLEAITVVPVPGAFELPLAAMALAKTRRFSCVVALGCVIRGETPHFEFVAGEAASGLQLAAIETGVPVSFGLLTVETKEQAEARIGKGAEAARAALEMADLFTQVRTRAARAG
jgi:6,7-dimethyl-8-ribityllumazine synthase